ncbi:hypothetical protein AB6Q56_07745 [Dechloromonas sp. ARDL1]|uniref:hypothetical protein n=1 Tax=Dechloromonas sp. ARDL1 TaxID=3322121 RepID=UPI003DA714EB
MARKQRREREKSKREEAWAQSMDKLIFLGEVADKGEPKSDRDEEVADASDED